MSTRRESTLKPSVWAPKTLNTHKTPESNEIQLVGLMERDEMLVDDEDSCTTWTGGVNHELSDSENEMSEWLDEDDEGVMDEEADIELEELAPCLDVLSRPTHYEKILTAKPAAFWKKTESQCFLGYNGLSDQTQQHHAKVLRDKEMMDVITRESDPAKQFQSFFTVQPKPQYAEVQTGEEIEEVAEEVDDSFQGYLSDFSDMDSDDGTWKSDDVSELNQIHPTSVTNIISPPPKSAANSLFPIMMPESKRE
ncbi:hypothetical protein BDQ17DRAFT_1327493 [Cyathus striatus]|nr:hypothetical protein BDQ17DRAFT_1327493 [Cyathus striatus]